MGAKWGRHFSVSIHSIPMEASLTVTDKDRECFLLDGYIVFKEAIPKPLREKGTR